MAYREIPRPDYEYDIAQLKASYQKAVADILAELERLDVSKMSRAQSYAALNNIAEILSGIDKESAAWVERMIPTAARDGIAGTLYTLGVAKSIEEAHNLLNLSKLQKEYIAAIVADTQKDLLAMTTYIEKNVRTAVRQVSGEVLRRNFTAGINGHNTNKREILAGLKEKLGESVKTGIIDAGRNRWRPEVYAEMLVRTKTMEAHLESSINEGLQEGARYGRISKHGATDACSKYEGKIVKLDPAAPGDYPTLASLRGGRDIFHPNCKHTVSPVFLDNEEATPPLPQNLQPREAAPAYKYQPAKTIKEANAWSKDNLPIPHVDYKGYDVRLANDVNENLEILLTRFPEIKNIQFVGTIQARNKAAHERWVEDYFQSLIPTNKDYIEQHGLDKLREYAKKKVKKPKAAGNCYAQAANETWKSEAGVTFNQKWAKDYDALSASTARDVSTSWHPVGTESPASIVTHEFGHMVDYFIESKGLREKYLMPIVNAILAESESHVKANLSKYAYKNDREVIAEAFAEYIHNPEPRRYARQIGKAIEAAFVEIRGGKQ